jgi:hypothetical protein
VGFSSFVFANYSSNFLSGSVNVFFEDSLCNLFSCAFLSANFKERCSACFVTFLARLEGFFETGTARQRRFLLCMSFDGQLSFLATATYFSNAFCFSLANLGSQFSTGLFSQGFGVQASLLAMFKSDSSANFVVCSKSTFFQCTCFACTV